MGGGGGSDLYPHFLKRGDCVKMLKTPGLDDDFKMANKVFWQTIRRLRGK